MNSLISIEGIECYAHHGCMEEESVIGQRYYVDVVFEFGFEKAMQTDNLEDTIDYAGVNKIVLEEMAIRSKLLEHVAGRIITALEKKFSAANNIKVTVTKFNPPVNGNIRHVKVTASKK